MTTDDVIEVGSGGPPERRRGRRTALAVTVAALVAAGGVAAWALGGDGTGTAAGSGASCPGSTPNVLSPSFDLTVAVPQQPTAPGVDGRLVPARAPRSVVVCEYGSVTAVTAVGVAVGPSETGTDVAAPTPAVSGNTPAVPGKTPDLPATPPPTDLPLGQVVERAGSDTAVSELLTTLQQATVRAATANYDCGVAYSSGLVMPQFLVGLSYDDGVVWVAGPDVCLGSTNGVAVSAVDLSGPVAAVLATGGGVGGSAVPPGTGSAVPPSPAVEPGSVLPQPGTVPPGATGAGPGAAGSGAAGSGSPPAGDPTDPFAACVAAGLPVPGPADRMLTFTPTSVRVCHAAVDPAVTAPTVSEQPAAVATVIAAALAGLPVLAPDQACTAMAGERWALLFADATGRTGQVLVDTGGCRTASNGGRTVRVDAPFLARLTALG